MQNGRYTASRYGGLNTIAGTEALAQRIAMKLAARRGGFAPWPEYGSRLYTLLGTAKPSEYAAVARQFITEALADEQGLTIGDITAADNGDGTLSIGAGIDAAGKTLTINLTV